MRHLFLGESLERSACPLRQGSPPINGTSTTVTGAAVQSGAWRHGFRPLARRPTHRGNDARSVHRCPHQPQGWPGWDVESALMSRKLIGNVGGPGSGAWISSKSFESRPIVEAK